MARDVSSGYQAPPNEMRPKLVIRRDLVEIYEMLSGFRSNRNLNLSDCQQICCVRKTVWIPDGPADPNRRVTYCSVGEWDNQESLVNARPAMIGFLDSVRHMLDEISS